MSTENTIVEPTETNLDDFAADFFGRKEAAPVETNTEVVEESSEESDAQEEDTHADGDDTSAPDNDDDTGEEEDTPVEEAPKPKKNRFQERIDELNGKFRETERKLNEALARLAEKENKIEPTTQKVASEGPKPTDTKEDGTEKYPLGEFDPNFIRDLMKHTLEEESKIREETAKVEKEKREREEAQAALQTNWNEKLVAVQERYPDFQEKGEQMLSAFEGIDAAYGEYLTNTIMDMEYGPDVFYYLSNNLDVAEKIISSGPKKATIALGRLEARFEEAQEKPISRPRVSNAPPPPERLNKGSAVAAPTIKGDEKDLDSFASAFFKKGRTNS